MRVPAEAGSGEVKITLSYPDWPEGNVAPATLDALLIGEQGDLPALAKALKSGGAAARAEVAVALGLFSGQVPGTAQLLIDAAKDSHADVRYHAVEALSRVTRDREQVVLALMRAAKDADNGVSSEAISALGSLARQNASPPR